MSKTTNNELSLTVKDVREDLGIDTVDEALDNRLERYINVADAWLKGAIGDNYPKDDERAIQLALLIIEDLYDRKSTTVKENNSLIRLKNDFILQLQMEVRDGNVQSSDTNSET